MDNWYPSLRLYLFLLSKNTLACSTVRVDRGIPQQLREAAPASNTSVGLCGDHKIVATKFHSTKIVHLLSTAHGHEEQTVPNRYRREEIVKPSSIIIYNHNMSGVDRLDRIIEMVKKNCFFISSMLHSATPSYLQRNVVTERQCWISLSM